ncbi:MAG TPA: hypothetical protein VFY17_04540, partial [Pilimelia sp.]|nr:hypothetical protein [Pilimelia sp.]
ATPTGWAGPGGTVAPVTPPAREPAAGRAGSPTGGPSLPVTGLALSWILAAGVGLLVVGVLLTRTTRRGAHRAR